MSQDAAHSLGVSSDEFTLRLSCHAHSFPCGCGGGVQGLGQIDMQYISMAELWWRGHEASVCTRGTKLIHGSSMQGETHTAAPIHQPSDSPVNVWLHHKSAAGFQGSCARPRFPFIFLFFSSFLIVFSNPAVQAQCSPSDAFSKKDISDDGAGHNNYRREMKAHYGLP